MTVVAWLGMMEMSRRSGTLMNADDGVPNKKMPTLYADEYGYTEEDKRDQCHQAPRALNEFVSPLAQPCREYLVIGFSTNC